VRAQRQQRRQSDDPHAPGPVSAGPVEHWGPQGGGATGRAGANLRDSSLCCNRALRAAACYHVCSP